MRAALTEGVDYGTIPGCGPSKPAMFKSGGEMLLKAAGLVFTMERIDDDDARETTRASPTDAPSCGARPPCGGCATGTAAATRPKPAPPANWNTIVKIAQKRALVGAALNATASSWAVRGRHRRRRTPPPGRQHPRPRPTTRSSRSTRKDSCGRAISELSEAGFEWFDGTQESGPHGNCRSPTPTTSAAPTATASAWHILVAQQIKPQMPLRAVDPEEPF